MIGMSQIRKRLIYGILIGAGIGVVGIVITAIWAVSVVNSYKDGTNKEYIANHTTEVVMLNDDVIQGETITADMLTTARVHKSSSPANQAGYNAVGKIAKYNIPANIPLVNSMFGDQIVTTDERIQEISSVALPTGLVEGEYIDVKIKMASGLEYVVLPQIRVERIFGNTVWLYLDEEQLYLLNSAIVDTYLNEGVTLYGVKYVDPTTQIKMDDVYEDEEGNKISITNQARKFLMETIEEDVANGTEVLEIPEAIISGPALEEKKENTDAGKEETTENEEKSEAEKLLDEEKEKEYINFTNNLTDLILKYAIEYRYYVESYNKVERTYQPSAMVREHMIANDYITEVAKKSLDADLRRKIEEKLEQFKNNNAEDGFDKAVSGLESQIAAQQALRESTLAGQ